MASTTSLFLSFSSLSNRPKIAQLRTLIPSPRNPSLRPPRLKAFGRRWRSLTISAALPPLDLTEENIRQVLIDARSEGKCSLPIAARHTAVQSTVRSRICRMIGPSGPSSKKMFAQLFDTSVGITGQVDLAELDGPFVKIRLKGRFWHMRNTVLERISNYLKNRIPEILEVDIEDEKQLDDSPENF